MYRSIRAAAFVAAIALATPANAALLYTFTADGFGTTYAGRATDPSAVGTTTNFYRAIFTFVLGPNGRFIVPQTSDATFVQGDISFQSTRSQVTAAVANGFQPRDNFGSTSVTACGNFDSTLLTSTGYLAVTPNCGSATFSIASYITSTRFSGQVTSFQITSIPDGQAPFTFAQAIPEPATWALMLTGFAITGYALRRRRASVAFG